MKIALVLTVKNEERLLRHNLLYHKAIGADHIFIYFDDTTDSGKESISDLDFVTINDSVAVEKYARLEYLEKFTSQAGEHHTARQCLNTFDAQQQCEKNGIDWLISLDADELICTDFREPSNLKYFFQELTKMLRLYILKPSKPFSKRKFMAMFFWRKHFSNKTGNRKKEVIFTKNYIILLPKLRKNFRGGMANIWGKEQCELARELYLITCTGSKKWMETSQTS